MRALCIGSNNKEDDRAARLALAARVAEQVRNVAGKVYSQDKLSAFLAVSALYGCIGQQMGIQIQIAKPVGSATGGTNARILPHLTSPSRALPVAA